MTHTGRHTCTSVHVCLPNQTLCVCAVVKVILTYVVWLSTQISSMMHTVMGTNHADSD